MRNAAVLARGMAEIVDDAVATRIVTESGRQGNARSMITVMQMGVAENTRFQILLEGDYEAIMMIAEKVRKFLEYYINLAQEESVQSV